MGRARLSLSRPALVSAYTGRRSSQCLQAGARQRLHAPLDCMRSSIACARLSVCMRGNRRSLTRHAEADAFRGIQHHATRDSDEALDSDAAVFQLPRVHAPLPLPPRRFIGNPKPF